MSPRRTIKKELESIRISLPPHLIKKGEDAIRNPNQFIGIRDFSGLCEYALNKILT